MIDPGGYNSCLKKIYQNVLISRFSLEIKSLKWQLISSPFVGVENDKTVESFMFRVRTLPSFNPS